MAIYKQKPAVDIEERSHSIQILTPKTAAPSLQILREEIELTTGKSTNLGVCKDITWSALVGTPQFAEFKATLGFTEAAVFFGALRDLFDNLCDPNYGVVPEPEPEPAP